MAGECGDLILILSLSLMIIIIVHEIIFTRTSFPRFSLWWLIRNSALRRRAGRGNICLVYRGQFMKVGEPYMAEVTGPISYD